MINRKCPNCKKKCLSLFKVSWKIHVDNNISRCKSCGEEWRVEKEFKSTFGYVFIFYFLFLVFPYILFFLIDHFIVDLSNLISYLNINIKAFLIVSPLFIMEAIFLYLLPLEIEKR